MCPPCGVTVQFYLRFSVFTFRPYLRIRCFGCCYAPSNSLQRSVCYVPHTWDLSLVLPISSHRPLSLCLRLTSALSRCRHCFCWLLPLPKWVGELQALSSMVTFVAGDDCLSYIPQLVTKSESLTHSFPRSFLVTSLADFAAGLDSDLLLCPVRALRLYLLRARSLSTGRHHLFVSPWRPARPFLRTRCRSFGGGNCCCSGG